MTLAAIFLKHGCDKFSHHYDDFYSTLPEPKRMMEVGVHRGASLRAWREWWPEAVVWGIDTFDRHPGKKTGFDFDGLSVRLVQADSRTVNLRVISPLDGLGAPLPFDLIIDDGSHKPRDQAATFRNLWPLVAPGGVYVIEDVLLIADDGLIPAWFAAKRHDFNRAAFLELMAAIHEVGQEPTAHDFRAQSGKPESVLLVMRKPA